jgi:hypothetical protein
MTEKLNVIDMKDDETKRMFSQFINVKKLALGLTDEHLAHELQCDLKTVSRYMCIHLGGDRWKPGRIPDAIYRDFLTVLKTNHTEFEEFFGRTVQQAQQAHQDPTTNAPAQSMGSGALHIASIKVDSGATLNQSPIGAQTVNYGTINN